MGDTIRAFSKATPDRLCLTFKKVSARIAFVGQKCGGCMAKFGKPRKAPQYAPKPMKLGGE
jgi:hypothetical protein